jgi:hypothetical protein
MLTATIRSSNHGSNAASHAMTAEDFDEIQDPIAQLADQIADRVAARLRLKLVERPPEPRPTASEGLWTTRQVAARYGVGISFVYQHADELGCVRLGGGAKPRLRFDPEIVRERWHDVGAASPNIAPTRRRSTKQTTRARRRPGPADVDLLDYDREP